MLSLKTLPRWVRTTIAVAYVLWTLLLTGFGVVVAVMSLRDDVKLTVEFVTLLGGLLVAPILPFAQSFALPGGGRIDLGAEQARTAEAKAEFASPRLEEAAAKLELTPINLLEGDGK